MTKEDLQGFTPLPTDLQGWVHDPAVFDTLIEDLRPKVIIEIGSWKGMSTVLMAQTCKRLGLDTKIYCVDTWLGAIEFYTMPTTPERDLMKRHGYPQVYYQFLSNIVNEGVSEMITPIPLPSNLAHKILPKADLIYIDGSHEYIDIHADILNYEPLLNTGARMFGDDYTNRAFPGVRLAVDELLPKKEIISNWYWITKK